MGSVCKYSSIERSMTPFPKSQGRDLFQNIAFFKYKKAI